MNNAREQVQHLFPMDHAAKFIMGFAKNLEHTPSGLRWLAGDGVTELRVTPAHFVAPDGVTVVERVELTHSSSLLEEVSLTRSSALNIFAPLSAFVSGGPGAAVQYICKIDVCKDDNAAANQVYAPLICTEAATIGWHASLLARGITQAAPESSPLARTTGYPFQQENFQAVYEMACQRGWAASVNPGNFTVEFPWAAGAYSATYSLPTVHNWAREKLGLDEDELSRMAGATMLLQLMHIDHPFYGAGVQSRLQLPGRLAPTHAALMADELNRWELSGPDFPPMFGAWCCKDGIVTFVTFIPAQSCVGGLLVNLLFWARARADRVRQWLRASTTRH